MADKELTVRGLPYPEGDPRNDSLKVLYISTVLMNAQVVVELGTDKGVSTGVFLEALKLTEGKLYTVDIAPCESARAKYHGDSNVEFVQADSIEYAEQFRNRDIDVLFCDTDHTYERTLNELRAWSNSKPSVIFVHDTLHGGELKPPFHAMRKFAEETKRAYVNLLVDCGLGIIHNWHTWRWKPSAT